MKPRARVNCRCAGQAFWHAASSHSCRDTLPIRMWQDLEGKFDVTTAVLATVLIALTLVAMVVMERLAGLSRRIT